MSQQLTAKISEKGCVSVIGLQRFPVSLYEGQWRALAAAMPGLIKFLDANKDHAAIKAARDAKGEKKATGAHVL
jgi:hypothetical protein